MKAGSLRALLCSLFILGLAPEFASAGVFQIVEVNGGSGSEPIEGEESTTRTDDDEERTSLLDSLLEALLDAVK